MGHSSSKLPRTSPINLQDYAEVALPAHTYHSIPNRRVIRSKFTGLELEEYVVEFLNQKEMSQYYEVFYWRMSQQHIARTLHFHVTKQSQCCSKICRARVYTQRILARLSDIKQIPYPDNLYVLFASADAFDKIVEKIGFFDIQENMIGINSQGEVKVWINEDLSSNSLDADSYECRSQREMAKMLVRIIDENTDTESQPSSLMKYINSRCSTLNFYNLMVLVKQYADIHKVAIPNNFLCVLDAVKYASSQASRTIERQRSVVNVADSPLFRKTQELIQPHYVAVSQIKHMPSQVRFQNYKVQTPTIQMMLSFLPGFAPQQRQLIQKGFQKRQTFGGNAASPIVFEPRKTMTRMEQITAPSISKFSPYSSSPISPFNSATLNNQEKLTQTRKFATEKTENTNLYLSADVKHSLRFKRAEHRTNGQSSNEAPSNYKPIPNKKMTDAPQKTLEEDSWSQNSHYDRNTEAKRFPIQRIWPPDLPFRQYLQKVQLNCSSKPARTYKNKTLDGGEYAPRRVSTQKEPHRSSFDPRTFMKGKYQMDPQIEKGLAGLYQTH